QPAKPYQSCSRKLAPESIDLLFLAQELAGNDEFLDFAGAFADGAEFHIAVILLHRVVLDKTVAAVNLHGFVRDADGDFAGEEFRHARFAGELRVLAVKLGGASRSARELM